MERDKLVQKKEILGIELTHPAWPRVLSVEDCPLEHIPSHVVSFSSILESLFQPLPLFSLLTKTIY